MLSCSFSTFKVCFLTSKILIRIFFICAKIRELYKLTGIILRIIVIFLKCKIVGEFRCNPRCQIVIRGKKTLLYNFIRVLSAETLLSSEKYKCPAVIFSKKVANQYIENRYHDYNPLYQYMLLSLYMTVIMIVDLFVRNATIITVLTKMTCLSQSSQSSQKCHISEFLLGVRP